MASGGGRVSDMEQPRTNGNPRPAVCQGLGGDQMPNCEQNLGCLDLFLARANSRQSADKLKVVPKPKPRRSGC